MIRPTPSRDIRVPWSMGPIDLFLDEPQAIDGGGALDYITTLVFALPGGDLPYWTHPVTATVHDFHASVRNFLVTVPEKDPFQPLLEKFNVGVNAFGVVGSSLNPFRQLLNVMSLEMITLPTSLKNNWHKEVALVSLMIHIAMSF